ncbi:Alg9-like mannosyltransferase family-domain-containing protein [Protomyces lactucae-debilis]|uniref:Mannosyltransferase n=1 Tax=Protomyces lactucae-debilis TaxID=2754530 RepID=A0A1Y2FJW5_PROLT|nr:Alg9-like mannosyltransferase family-domain-containing protein [Protomyces lactucae-debilis]ORY84240.1 Alg9-like mannosyltransferase family-domain-containing protein [Protomyces lactucae-debilis]
MDILDYVFGAIVLLYSVVAPFTKVEESFNLQAVHDILQFGVRPDALQHYDHFEFPGAVPRTFIGALGLSMLTWPLTNLCKLSFGESIVGPLSQVATRAVLGLVNVAALVAFRNAAKRVYGATVGTWYIVLQMTQFHVIYYASRTLPNLLAMPFTTLAATYFITPNESLTPALVLLTLSALIFRAEIVLLLATHVVFHWLITKRLTFWRTLRVGVRASAVGLGLTTLVDSYFWQVLVAPEVQSVMFNVIQGKSQEWGTSPFYTYAFDLVKLLLNPLAGVLILLGIIVDRRVLSFLMPALAFVGLYSFQPHKEWRFIIYVVPQMTLAAAIGASYIFNRRTKSFFWRYAAFVLMGSIPATALLSVSMLLISSHNYPGGEALAKLPLNGTGPVYLDVLTCMTGASRFLQAGPRPITKTEDPALLNSPEFWGSLEFAIVQQPGQLAHTPGWEVYDRVDSLKIQQLKQFKWEKETKLILYRNTLYNTSASPE